MWQSEQKEKEAFAAAWLREPDAFKAAVAVVGASNAGRALQIAATWVFDDYVLQHKADLKEEFGEDYFLPTKADTARKALEVFDTMRDGETKLKALRLYAEIMGHIAKPEQLGKIGNGIVAIPVSDLDAKL
jgi:hypothetical protein